MAKTRTWFVGIGCLVLLLATVFGVLLVRALVSASVPSQAMLSLRLGPPIVEIASDDPLEQLMGEGSLGLRQIRTALVRAASDDRIRGVRVRLDGFGGSFATAQEIRVLLDGVRRAGKWTAAYLDTAGEFSSGNLSYYVASGCDEVSLNPMGDVNFIGLSARSPFIRGTLDKLKITAEFPGRGDYKTARFMYTQRDFTPAHREMMEWLLDSLMGQIVQGVAESRGMEPQEVRELIDRAPFLGQEAVDAGLVDHLEDWSAFVERLGEGEDEDIEVIGLKRYRKAARAPARGPKIAVVTGVGTIMRGESRKELNPLFGGDVIGSATLAKAWRDVRRASGIKAVVFRVDSPGGSAIASEVIRQEMIRTAEDIPVVVSMSNVAASGGYWISCGAQRIVADPGTITASIGVFGGHINLDRFWEEKVGVTFGRLDRGANANLYGELEDWTPAQRKVIDRQLDRIYDAFVERVAAARGMTTDEVDAIARGRVFTGEQALERGLVDVLGGFDVAVAQAKELAGISPDQSVRLVDFPKPVPLWQRLLDKQGGEEAAVEQLRSLWQTGVVRTPGVVWMPPIYVE